MTNANIKLSFHRLSQHHFPLLLRWLKAPHVKLWWDSDIKWTEELIADKYSYYVNGYKKLTLQDQIIEKPIYAFVICLEGALIGYIQYYNRHDFPPERGYDISELPNSCAGLDWYLGEQEFTGKGIGTKALKLFLEQYVFQKFDNVFVDPEVENINAIRAYQKAGFVAIKDLEMSRWMIKSK